MTYFEPEFYELWSTMKIKVIRKREIIMSGIEKIKETLQTIKALQKTLQEQLAESKTTPEQLDTTESKMDELMKQHQSMMKTSTFLLLPEEDQKSSKAEFAPIQEKAKSLQIQLQLKDLNNLLDPNNKAMQKLAKKQPDVHAFILQDRVRNLERSISAYQSLDPQPKDCAELSASASLKVLQSLTQMNFKGMNRSEANEHAKALEEAKKTAIERVSAYAKTKTANDPNLVTMLKEFSKIGRECDRVKPLVEAHSKSKPLFGLSWHKSRSAGITQKEVKSAQKQEMGPKV